jgi:DNA-directed RNA polymerase specialized sigma subunit
MTKPGRGRRPILDKERDSEKVREIVKEHRQRFDIAKSELEKELGKSFSKKTLVRFLKVASAAVSSASGEGQ